MKNIFNYLFFIISLNLLGQDSIQNQVFLVHNNIQINSGDFLDIKDFKNITIENGADNNEYEIQFIVVPFQGTLLAFSKKESEIQYIDINELLNIGSISSKNIKHVMLNIRKNERSPVIYNTHIFTRKLETAEDYYNEFTLYAGIGEKESAIWCINQAIKLDSNNLKYLNAHAQLYFEIGDMEKSKNAFIKIIDFQPNYISFIYLATICLNQGNYENAKTYAKNSMKFNSTEIEKSNAFLIMADAEAKLLKFNSSYKSYKKALDFNPKNINALNNITNVLDEVKRSKEKNYYFKKILEIDSSFYLVHINIGFNYLDEKNFDLALKEFDAVLIIDPNHAIALSNKSFALLKLGRLEEALTTINLSLKIDPTNSYAYRNKALILLEIKDASEACKALNEAIKYKFTEQYGEEVLLLKKQNCK